MAEKNQDSAIAATLDILRHYSFEAGRRSYGEMLDQWLKVYPLSWIKLAVVESLYQGRYKVISVEQILALWQRRGEPLYHFNREFQRLVLNNLPNDFRYDQDSPGSSSVPLSGRKKTEKRVKRSRETVVTAFPVNAIPSYRRQIKPIELDEPVSLSADDKKRQPARSDLLDSAQKDIVHNAVDSAAMTDDMSEGAVLNDIESTEIEKVDRFDQEPPSQPQVMEIKPSTDLERSPEGILSEESEPSMDCLSSQISDQSSVGFYHNPIVQFTPKRKFSGFHSKLTAIAQPKN